jgi:hypothetical protein
MEETQEQARTTPRKVSLKVRRLAKLETTILRNDG